MVHKPTCPQWTENSAPSSRGYIRLKGLLAFRYAAGVIREYISREQCLMASDRQQRIPNSPVTLVSRPMCSCLSLL